jgi:hypothetical protein
MTISRITLFAAVTLVAIGALIGSARVSPASAGGLDWLSNDGYVRCLKYVSALAHGDDAAYDRGRRACNRQYYPNRPGTQY